MRRFWALAAASPSCYDGARFGVVWQCTGGVGRTERMVRLVMKTLLIAMELPFVRFVTGLMPEGRRDMKFCAE